MDPFNFKSQICTSREQSERLLALGLKPETADCYYWQECDQYGDPNGKWHLDILNDDTREHFEYLFNHFGICLHIEDDLFIPAWSLHRLIEMIKKSDYLHYNDMGCIKLYLEQDDFDTIITIISIMVKEKYFNKKYLEE